VAEPARISGRTLGHYRVLEQIAAGGMGVVYRAHDERLERDVAIKVLPAGILADETARKRFRKEALAISRLNHPNIATVYDFDSQDEIDFLVMELISGMDIDQKVVSGALTEKEIVALGRQITEGLAVAHEHGIIHRDLKPGNLRVTPDGRLKILDFGLAQVTRPARLEEPTQSLATEAVSGTLPYMAPEQLAGETPDQRSDIYAVGTVLYEMATGRRPFTEKLATKLTDAILHLPPVTPRAFNAKVSPELERIILKCLEKDPSHRYHSARELEVDLLRLASGGTTVPVSTRTAFQRHRAWASVALTLLVLVTVVGGLYFLRARAHDEPIGAVAVLPFQNASDDPNGEYLSDGISETLIGNLSQLSGLRVMARDTVFSYKGRQVDPRQAGRDLKVDAVVTGRVIERANTLIVEADLVKVADGRELWGERYNRKLTDLITVQGEIADEITQKLRLHLTEVEKARFAKHYTENAEAYRLYLKGRYFASKATPEDMAKGMGYLNQAIALDPTYALAYDGIAYYYLWANDLLLAPRDAMPKAKEAAKQALKLDDGLPQAHTEMGMVLFQYEWDWAGAEREFQRAIQLDPRYASAHEWYGYLLVSEGRIEDGIQEAKRAVELDPLSPECNWLLGWMLYFARQYGLSAEQLHKTIDLDPNYFLAHLVLGMSYAGRAKMNLAIPELERATSLGECNQSLGELGRAYALSGKPREAQKIADRLVAGWKRSHVGAFEIALIEIGLGDKDEALAWLEQAYEDRAFFMVDLKNEPELDVLRSHPRFQELVRRMNFPP